MFHTQARGSFPSMHLTVKRFNPTRAHNLGSVCECVCFSNRERERGRSSVRGQGQSVSCSVCSRPAYRGMVSRSASASRHVVRAAGDVRACHLQRSEISGECPSERPPREAPSPGHRPSGQRRLLVSVLCCSGSGFN